MEVGPLLDQPYSTPCFRCIRSLGRRWGWDHCWISRIQHLVLGVVIAKGDVGVGTIVGSTVFNILF